MTQKPSWSPGLLMTMTLFARKRRSNRQLVEEFTYLDAKPVSHHIQKRDASGFVEDITYDVNGNMTAHPSERYDEHGRAVEWVVFDHDRLVLHQRDDYTDSHDDAGALISRAWFDKTGLLFRQITFQNGQDNVLVATAGLRAAGANNMMESV
jgi:hypothetical protein